MKDSDAYLVPAPLLQRLVGYLAERPYKEVAGLIAALQQQAAEAPRPPPVAETPARRKARASRKAAAFAPTPSATKAGPADDG